MDRTLLGLVLVISLALSHATSVQLSSAAQAKEHELEDAWSKDLAGAPAESKKVEYKSPIDRVVGLLEKMKSELEAEAAKEAEMYDKMVCWSRPTRRKRRRR